MPTLPMWTIGWNWLDRSTLGLSSSFRRLTLKHKTNASTIISAFRKPLPIPLSLRPSPISSTIIHPKTIKPKSGSITNSLESNEWSETWKDSSSEYRTAIGFPKWCWIMKYDFFEIYETHWSPTLAQGNVGLQTPLNHLDLHFLHQQLQPTSPLSSHMFVGVDHISPIWHVSTLLLLKMLLFFISIVITHCHFRVSPLSGQQSMCQFVHITSYSLRRGLWPVRTIRIFCLTIWIAHSRYWLIPENEFGWNSKYLTCCRTVWLRWIWVRECSFRFDRRNN